MSKFFLAINLLAVIAGVAVFPVLYPLLVKYIPAITKYSPEDVLNRLIILSIFITTWLSYPRLGLNNIGLKTLNKQRCKVFLYGTAIGLVVVGLYYVGKVIVGHGIFQWPWSSYGKFLLTLGWYMLGALTVGLIEETFFRGIALQVFQNDVSTRKHAIILSSLFFSIVHFLDLSLIIELLSGKYPASMFSLNSVSPVALGQLVRFLMLFLLGIAFATICVRSKSLYGSIGLHAGLVFTARLAGKSTVAAPGQSMVIFNDGILNSLLVIGAIGLMFLLIRFVPLDHSAFKMGIYSSRKWKL